MLRITEVSRLIEKRDYSMHCAHQRNVQNKYQRGGKEQQTAFFIASARPFGCRVKRSRVCVYRGSGVELGDFALADLGHTFESMRAHAKLAGGDSAEPSCFLWQITNFELVSPKPV